MPVSDEYPVLSVLDNDVISTPGANKSGFLTLSLVGPLLENAGIVKESVSEYFLSSQAPTDITNLLVAGESMLLGFGPLFPTADITISPFSIALFAAFTRGSTRSEF